VRKKNDTLIIIPAFNEAWNIVELLHELNYHNPNCDLVVVNDASWDGTGRLAEQTGLAYVLNMPYNLGIGGAVQSGFKLAKKMGYKYALQFDGDGQHLPDQVQRLLKLVKMEKADVVIGSRFCKKDKSYKSSALRRVGIRLFKYITLFLIRKRIHDCTSGFRAYNSRAISFLALNYPPDFPEPETIILLGKNRFKISEIFTPMKDREGGKSSISRKGVFYMCKVLLAMFMTAIRPKIKNFELA